MEDATLLELAVCALVARGVVVKPVVPGSLSAGWEVKLAPEEPAEAQEDGRPTGEVGGIGVS